MEKDLNRLREDIDRENKIILDAFVRRMQDSVAVGAYKRAHGLPVRDAGRETALLAAIADMTPDEWKQDSRALFTRLMQLSRAAQIRSGEGENPYKAWIADAKSRAPSVIPPYTLTACQGEAGSYAQKAAEKVLDCPRILYFSGFDAVFRALEQGLCRYAVLPIENSTAGSVNRVYDLMRAHRFCIMRSYRLKVDHTLMGIPGATLDGIREVYSNEQALAQCDRYLHGMKGDVRLCSVENTAAAAKAVATAGKAERAAVCSADCAALYGLVPLADHIQNNDNNYTRFICVSAMPEIHAGADRVSLMMTLPHRAGALYEVLSEIDAHGINLEKLESRPLPDRDFEFMFYFDLRISAARADLPALLLALERMSESFRLLGAYSETV